jgi:hypothetical protein
LMQWAVFKTNVQLSHRQNSVRIAQVTQPVSIVMIKRWAAYWNIRCLLCGPVWWNSGNARYHSFRIVCIPVWHSKIQTLKHSEL